MKFKQYLAEDIFTIKPIVDRILKWPINKLKLEFKKALKQIRLSHDEQKILNIFNKRTNRKLNKLEDLLIVNESSLWDTLDIKTNTKYQYISFLLSVINILSEFKVFNMPQDGIYVLAIVLFLIREYGMENK